MNVQMEPVGQAVIDAALAEVKAWLRIETAMDDAALRSLSVSAIAFAEDFCGQIICMRAGVERVSASPQWVRLIASPVVSVNQVFTVPAHGGGAVEVVLPGYGADIDAVGDAYVRMAQPGEVTVIDVYFMAGFADDWAAMPQALRQGIVRLTAHLFAERDGNDPPAIVAALWRPWRRMRLS